MLDSVYVNTQTMLTSRSGCRMRRVFEDDSEIFVTFLGKETDVVPQLLCFKTYPGIRLSGNTLVLL